MNKCILSYETFQQLPLHQLSSNLVKINKIEQLSPILTTKSPKITDNQPKFFKFNQKSPKVQERKTHGKVIVNE